MRKTQVGLLMVLLAVVVSVYLTNDWDSVDKAGSPTASAEASFNPHGVVLGEGDQASGRSDGSRETSKETSDEGPRAMFSPNSDGTYDIPESVDVTVPEWVSWEGPTCAPPQRGSSCSVPFWGRVFSKQENGRILLLAFENGSNTAAAAHPIPATKDAITRVDHWLPYVIGPKTEYITFKAVLESAGGKVVAEGRPYIVSIKY